MYLKIRLILGYIFLFIKISVKVMRYVRFYFKMNISKTPKLFEIGVLKMIIEERIDTV
jgi:hypothetical protein